MLLVVSPAKTLDYDTPPPTKTFTIPEMMDDSKCLINVMRNKSALDIAELMKLSISLAELNFDRYIDWQPPFTPQNAKQTVLAMKGPVYTGIDAQSFTQQDFEYAQHHLRILSGLHGLLKPLDLMQPYRLEMGTRLKTEAGKNLYEFWGTRITDAINKTLQHQGDNILVNLASTEYFKSVKPKLVKGRIITPHFKERKGDIYKVLGVYAKKARGQMARFVITNQISEPDGMKDFQDDGYIYNEQLSQPNDWVFSRG